MPNVTSRTLKDAIRTRYAWPGGYEIFGLTDDGAVLCTPCMRTEWKQIAYARRHGLRNGWHVVGIATTECAEESVTCDHCGKDLNQ
jgi:hypothetical protein